MDAGEYDTNTLLINNLSSIAFRIYEPVVSQSSTYTFVASDVESALRRDGYLVYMDIVRRGIWCFYLPTKDAATSTEPERVGLGTTIEVCGYTLGLVDEGGLEPISLHKSRVPGSNSINTPNSSSSSGSALDATLRTAQSFHVSSATSAGGHAPMDIDSKQAPHASQDAKGYGSVPPKEVHDFFITATLASLSMAFCARVGGIPLSLRSVLLPPSMLDIGRPGIGQRPGKAAIATFRVYLTTTGTLIISLYISMMKGLVSMAQGARDTILPAGTPVLAAPMGAFGSFQGILDSAGQLEGGYVQSPSKQIARSRHEASQRTLLWRNMCSKLLEMRGIQPSILNGSSWLNIHFHRRKPFETRADGKKAPLSQGSHVLSWPSVLCYRKAPKCSVTRCRAEKQPDQDSTENFDTLSLVQTWYQDTPRREEALARKLKEREAARLKEIADIDERNLQFSAASPVAFRGMAGSGAPHPAGAMYPTPPDGVPNPVGATPSFSGNVSSPANAPATTVTAEVDVPAEVPPPLSEAFPDPPWDGEETKQEPPNAALIEGDNLFGDLGDNIFEGEDITDADFNFFDEQAGSNDFDLSALPDIGSVMDIPMPVKPEAESLAPSPPQREVETKTEEASATAPRFAKPELRHARSSLNGENRQQQHHGNTRTNSAAGVKRQPSPFNPDTVYKRIRASFSKQSTPQLDSPNQARRRQSFFGKVEFDQSLMLANKKYGETGQFNYSLSPEKVEEESRDRSEEALTARHGLRLSRPRKNLKALPSNIGLLIAKITGGLEQSSLRHEPMETDDPPSEGDDISLISDEDDSSDTTDEPSSPMKTGLVRRHADDDGISMAASFKDLERATSVVESPGFGTIDLTKLSNPDTPELFAAKYFQDPEPAPTGLGCSEDEYITIAQILTEQAVAGHLRLGYREEALDVADSRREFVDVARSSLQHLRAILPRALSQATEARVRSFIEAQDVPLLGQPSRMQPRAVGEGQRPNLFQIAPPHVELSRSDSTLALLPTAVPFWETLGLGPSQGTKDVSAICVFPNWEGVANNSTAFIDRLKIVYDSLKLGSFERFSDPLVHEGLLPYDVERAVTSIGLDQALWYPRFGDALSMLAPALADSTAQNVNFVVFMVYLPEESHTITQACAAFHDLFERFKMALSEKKKNPANDLVLQLVPLDAVASSTALAALSPVDYMSYCLETYDRCTLFDGPMPASAIILERALPRMIDFKAQSTPSANVLMENSCIHIAYAQSVDERWVTAAWTDNYGSKQMTASYCLGRRGKPLSTPFADVASEIWDTTHDLISLYKVHWRLMITKCGPMDQAEIDLWTSLAQGESKASVSLTLATVDTNPSLQLIPPEAKISVHATNVFYTTPVSTPQPSTVSPDPTGSAGANNPSTPVMANSSIGNATATTPGGGADAGGAGGAEQPDADATLVDATDTTWGAVVSHRLNVSGSLTELSPALVSGYLLKRGGPRPDDPPCAMEVNVVHSEGTNPRVYEALLREMLAHFRGLGALARARGTVDREADVRPWHVAAAEKGVKALYQLM